MRSGVNELISIYQHLGPTDRTILELLDEHQVLTTGQLHRVCFRHLRTCQRRLAVLHRLDLLARFRFRRPGGGSEPWHWTLGPLGARLQAAANGRPAPTTRHVRDRLERISAGPRLTHLLGVNEFFVQLLHRARSRPEERLVRWWSEQRSTSEFLGIQPDGHGLWSIHGKAVGFFLEHDTGSEPLTRLVSKLDGYARMTAAGGPAYAVLFRLPTLAREENLQRVLTRAPVRSLVATSTHEVDPAEAVWWPAGELTRVTMAELPSDHGPNTVRNPNWRDGVLRLDR